MKNLKICIIDERNHTKKRILLEFEKMISIPLKMTHLKYLVETPKKKKYTFVGFSPRL